MHDARGVHRGQRVAHLHRDGQELARRQAALRPQARRERLAVQQLHHEVRRAVGQVPVVDDLDDVRVPRQAERLCLAPQPVARDGLVRRRGAQQLDGDGQAVRDAHRLVDDARRARAHAPQDAVLTRRDRALELPAHLALARLAQRQAPLERVHAERLRVRLRAPHAVARAHARRARRPPRRTPAQRASPTAVDAELRQQGHEAHRRPTRAADRARDARVGHRPLDLELLREPRRARLVLRRAAAPSPRA